MKEGIKEEYLRKEVEILQESLKEFKVNMYFYSKLEEMDLLSEITLSYPLKDFKSKKTKDKDLRTAFENSILYKYFVRDGIGAYEDIKQRAVTYYLRKKYIII